MKKFHLKLLLYGASGAGKSMVAQTLAKIDTRCSLHIKDSTRPAEDRDSTSRDINSIDEESFRKNMADNKYAVVYRYGEDQHSYGVIHKQLADAAKLRQIHFIIVRDIRAIRTLLSTYYDTRAIYFHADPSLSQKNILSRESTTEQKAKRIASLPTEYNEYLTHSGLFDAVILNYADKHTLTIQMQNLIKRYERAAILRGNGI